MGILISHMAWNVILSQPQPKPTPKYGVIPPTACFKQEVLLQKRGHLPLFGPYCREMQICTLVHVVLARCTVKRPESLSGFRMS